MVKPHTIKSISKYIGNKVTYRGLPYILQSVSINTTIGDYCSLFPIYSDKDSVVYTSSSNIKVIPDEVTPILKDYTYLLTPMQYNGEEIIPMDYVYGFVGGKSLELIDISEDFICDIDFIPNNHYRRLSHTEASYLIELEFGAIKSPGSSSGWRDPFNNLCVSYKDFWGNYLWL